MRVTYNDYIVDCKGIYGSDEKDDIIAEYSERVIELGYIEADWEEGFHHEGYSRTYKMYKPETAFDFFLNNWRKFADSKPLRVGRHSWIKLANKNAIAHYENSILKLALRIEAKELNQDKLEMVTSHIDVNISTTITDGDKTVRAWTIIAEGPIQRPHYRYLVK